MVHYELAQSIHCQNGAWFAGLEHLLLQKKVHSETWGGGWKGVLKFVFFRGHHRTKINVIDKINYTDAEMNKHASQVHILSSHNFLQKDLICDNQK